MAKSSWKLIMRSKGFLVFGLLIPLISTLFINLWYREPDKIADDGIIELETHDQQMAYEVDYNRYPVKVYDTEMSDKTTGVCNDLNSAGMFQVYRVDASSMSDEEIRDSYVKTAKIDRVGAVIVLSENAEDTELYSVGDDERFELLESSLENALANEGTEHSAPQITFVSGDGDEVDYYETRNFSYCLAISSLSFAFGGVLVLSTVLSEKKDKVFSRLMLTNADRSSYLFSKFLLSTTMSLFQAAIMTICFLVLVKVDIGINALQFAILVFLVGIIFNLLSLSIGLYFDSMAPAAVMTFVIWSMSALLAGTYFDISNTSDIYKKVSLLMPQRWALFSVSRLIHGDTSGYSMILCVTSAYLVIIFVIGVMGLRLREE